jgi:hypothetical protein
MSTVYGYGPDLDGIRQVVSRHGTVTPMLRALNRLRFWQEICDVYSRAPPPPSLPEKINRRWWASSKSFGRSLSKRGSSNEGMSMRRWASRAASALRDKWGVDGMSIIQARKWGWVFFCVSLFFFLVPTSPFVAANFVWVKTHQKFTSARDAQGKFLNHSSWTLRCSEREDAVGMYNVCGVVVCTKRALILIIFFFYLFNPTNPFGRSRAAPDAQ